jgi:hypothetical protein
MIASVIPLFGAERTFERPREGLIERLCLADSASSMNVLQNGRWNDTDSIQFWWERNSPDRAGRRRV